MSETVNQPATENVGRGILMSLIAIPLAVLLFAIVGAWGSYFVFFVSVFIPGAAAFFYRAGSGGVIRNGRVPFVIVAAVAVIVGVIAGIISTAYANFTAVGGDGGPFGDVFRSTLVRQLGTEDFIFQGLIGLVLGVVGIVGALTSARKLEAQQQARTAAERIALDLPEGTAPEGTPIAPPVELAGESTDNTPEDAAPRRPAKPSTAQQNATSPGIMLNGKPLDPDARS